MYADVVVLTYQSPDIDSYTYEIPNNLETQIKIGQLVEVPFGKRNPLGIVLALKSHPRESEDRILDQVFDRESQVFDSETQTRGTESVKNDTEIVIKAISRIVFTEPLFLPYQIELLKWLSAYYIAPMVNCLEAMIPKLPSRQLSVHSSQKEMDNTVNRQPLTVNQTLVLVPSINRIPWAMAQFPKAKNYAIYHNNLKSAEKFSTSRRILDGSVDYIFGSRSAIFAPCPNLKKIIIYDEHDNAYKDERSPYLDTLTVAEKVAALTKSEIEIVDASPKITTYFNFQKNIKINFQKTRFRIISLEKERLGGNYSPVAHQTEEYLKRVVKSKKNALLFLNKKTESGHVFCKSCKERTFVETQPDTCPNCKSANIFFNSLNIYSLTETVKKITHPYPVNIIEQKGRTYSSQNSIDIATSFVFYSQPLKKYELVIFTFADSITQIADFSSEEKLYATAANLKSLLLPNGLLVIQTYNLQNQTINYAVKGDYKSFYKEQVSNRKLLSYPPFALLIKLTLKGKNKEKIESDANRLITQLHRTIELSNYQTIKPTIQLLGPFKPAFFYKQPQFNIIIKYKLGSYSLSHRQNAIEKLRPILKNLKNVQVTVEPESLN